MDLHEIAPDSYSTSAHKWLMGPLEAGLLYVRGERISELWPSIDAGIVTLSEDFLNLIGVPVVEARVRALATHTKVQLTDLGNVELKTNMEPALCGGVVKFRLRNVSTKRAYDTL